MLQQYNNTAFILVFVMWSKPNLYKIYSRLNMISLYFYKAVLNP